MKISENEFSKDFKNIIYSTASTKRNRPGIQKRISPAGKTLKAFRRMQGEIMNGEGE